MTKKMYRNIQSLLLFITMLVLSASFYFEYAQGLQACPLCIMQRFCTFLFGLLCLLGLCLTTLRRARRVAVLQIIFMMSGLFFAARQLWLQSLPVESTSVCMPGLNALVHYFPKEQLLKALFWGTGDCGEVTWRLFGLSMPAWSAVYFVTMLLVSAVVFFAVGRQLAEIERA